MLAIRSRVFVGCWYLCFPDIFSLVILIIVSSPLYFLVFHFHLFLFLIYRNRPFGLSNLCQLYMKFLRSYSTTSHMPVNSPISRVWVIYNDNQPNNYYLFGIREDTSIWERPMWSQEGCILIQTDGTEGQDQTVCHSCEASALSAVPLCCPYNHNIFGTVLIFLM